MPKIPAPIEAYHAKKRLLAIQTAHLQQPSSPPPPPVFSLAISCGTADVWTLPASQQKKVMEAIDDVCRETGWDMASGMTALDTVEAVIYALENMGYFNAGKGATKRKTWEGPSSSAAILGGGDHTAGIPIKHGVAVGIQNFKNPIRVARAFLDRGLKVRFAANANELGVGSRCRLMPADYFEELKNNWLDTTKVYLFDPPEHAPAFIEGVSVVARDMYGNIAAGMSTGGPAGEGSDPTKMPPVCASVLCDGNTAIICSGSISNLMNYEPARLVCYLNRSPNETINTSVDQVHNLLFQKNCHPSSLIALDRAGTIAIRSSARINLVSTCSNLASAWTRVQGSSIPVCPRHLIRSDPYLDAGFTRYPITDGHVVATLKDCTNISDLNYTQFMQTMVSLWSMALALTATMDVPFIGLSCNGTGTLSLLPFPRKSAEWVPEHFTPTQRDPTLPYLTSKKGPEIESIGLTALVHAKLGGHLTSSYKIRGCPDPDNLYTRIICGQSVHYRVWEDHEHVAFLDPYGSSVGVTVVVPRKQVCGDVFSLRPARFISLMRAVYYVMQLLRDGLEDDRIGVFFDGYREAFGCVVLVPMRDQARENCVPVNMAKEPKFYEEHPGYLTTQLGRRVQAFENLSELKEKFLELEGQKGKKKNKSAKKEKKEKDDSNTLMPRSRNISNPLKGFVSNLNSKLN